MACAAKVRTALEKHSRQMKHMEDAAVMLYPMYTVPLEALLLMTEVRPHQELLEDQVLVEYTSSCGKAMFVSHQWLAASHPDPKCRQLKVLQDALQNVLSGAVKIVKDVTLAFRSIRSFGYSQKDLKAAPIFVWYDYFSCPQPAADKMSLVKSIVTNPCENLRRSIASIPAYVAKCQWFVALCPTLRSADDSSDLNQYTWAKRGWCRAEKMARELSDRHGLVLMVDSPEHLTLLPVWESFQYSPGDGDFSVPSDVGVVGEIMRSLLRTRLQGFLQQGDLHNYRFYMNQQRVRFRACPVEPVDALVPGCDGGSPLEAFFHQNGFVSVKDRDSAGWSPLCYAAMNGDPLLVKALLANWANPNDRIFYQKPEALLYAGTSVLAICAAFGSNEAMQLLLSVKAKVNQRDSALTGGGTALHATVLCDNAEGARILLAARGDPNIQRVYPNDVLELASAMGAIQVIHEILPCKTRSQHLLHWALMMRGGSPEVISSLLQARMDVNEQFRASKFRFKAAFSLFQVKNHLVDVSRCSSWGTMCYHLHGATPPMLSMLSRSFPAAQVLLAAGAGLDFRNSRGKTAFDLAVEQKAPLPLLSKLWAHGAEAAAINVARFEGRLAAARPEARPQASREMEDHGVDDIDDVLQDVKSQLKEATLSCSL